MPSGKVNLVKHRKSRLVAGAAHSCAAPLNWQIVYATKDEKGLTLEHMFYKIKVTWRGIHDGGAQLVGT
jgi:hypothetical protein